MKLTYSKIIEVLKLHHHYRFPLGSFMHLYVIKTKNKQKHSFLLNQYKSAAIYW